MTTLITGGAGFIGSYVAKALLAQGRSVLILDNFDPYYDPQLKRQRVDWLATAGDVTVVEGDVRDVALLESLFKAHDIRDVVHLAAMPNVRYSVGRERLYVDVNTTGTLNVLELAKAYQVRQFVLASTSSVYGQTERVPFQEDDAADRPLAAYPASKRAAELLAHMYYNLYGLNITILRFFNVYGPMGRPDMMPMRLMKAAFSGEQMKFFNGGDIKRDWTYIDDTVNGVLAALERPLGYEVINLGIGSPISLNDFVHIIEEYTGRKINAVAVPTPPSDPPITYCDNTKARELLDFSPQVDLREGLRRTWEWYRDTYRPR